MGWRKILTWKICFRFRESTELLIKLTSTYYRRKIIKVLQMQHGVIVDFCQFVGQILFSRSFPGFATRAILLNRICRWTIAACNIHILVTFGCDLLTGVYSYIVCKTCTF